MDVRNDNRLFIRYGLRFFNRALLMRPDSDNYLLKTVHQFAGICFQWIEGHVKDLRFNCTNFRMKTLF